uniref:PDZ domain-containing protein n=1 Tax=Pyrodinium bahamense TaxID=73915 RepID=A0A7S0B8X2_9DINO
MPPQWAGELATASKQLRDAGALPNDAPLIALQAGGEERLRLGVGRGDGDVKAFFVNKEELSQAGAGLARENPVPGVPDGGHGSLLLFADPKVPGTLTRNLLEALDARYPNAAKAGLVVLPVKAGEDAAAVAAEDWEPPRTGRQLRTRDRSDGHGWMKGDPTFNAADEALATPTLTAEFKRRPFGVKRYSPGVNGKGAMVMDMQEKERYKGDAMGQAAVKGVRVGMAVVAVGGKDVRSWDFEDLMDLLNDQGIMDPDSKSAASWGEAGKAQRQPVPEAELPVSIGFAEAGGGGGPSLAPLCWDGVPKREGALGLALSEPATSALDLAGCQKLGPTLAVVKSGPNPDGGFAVDAVRVGDKEMPAAAALKGYAKASGLQSMKGISVGIKRPAPSGDCEASQWAVFPMAGVTKQGGLVLRCKGVAAEGLGSDEVLEAVQFFCPTAAEGALSRLAGLLGVGGAPVAFAAGTQALQGAPPGTFGVVGAAVIGGAGTRQRGGPGASAALHRQGGSLLVP